MFLMVTLSSSPVLLVCQTAWAHPRFVSLILYILASSSSNFFISYIETFVGRPAATAASPPNLLPLPTDDVTSILARFNDAGISTANAIWLLASHSVAAQNLVDPAVAGSPFDSTPATFDTQFYLEVLLKGTFGTTNANGEVEGPLDGELRLQSDFALARDSRTSCLWELPISEFYAPSHMKIHTNLIC